MERMFRFTFIILIVFSLSTTAQFPAQTAPGIEILNQSGNPVTSLTDGDLIQLRLRLDTPAELTGTLNFKVNSASLPQTCELAPGDEECTTQPFHAYGWFWAGSPAAQPVSWQVTALLGVQEINTASFTVQPRPVVMVHGFISNYETWLNYLGPQGYLAGAGIPAFAVGDGQAPGAMNTGSIEQPLQLSNTIAQNAAILAQYIQQVKAQTGAENIDLLAHSMGGMISRFYVDSLMPERDVAQLIMLGTPAAGTDCAILASSLGFYYPTILEIRSSYTLGIFNPQVELRHGVPFFALAGTKITTPVGSPCTDIPNDIVISVNSVTSIDLAVTQSPILHTEMNTSPQVFTDYVLPLLKRQPGDPWEQPDTPASPPAGGTLQFTRVFTGHVDAGGSTEQVINLEPGLAVASFGLYDATRSLAVTVTGASGNVIQLSPEANGLVTVDDPETLLTMGYGFNNPRPGPWKVLLSASERTPAAGADFALTARLAGGAELSASAEPLLPEVNNPVQVNASLNLAGSPVKIQSAQAVVRLAGALPQNVIFSIDGNSASGTWTPTSPGIHAIDIAVTALLEDGTQVERAAFLTVEAEAGPSLLPEQFAGPRLVLLSACLVLLLAAFLTVFGLIRRSRRLAKQGG